MNELDLHDKIIQIIIQTNNLNEKVLKHANNTDCLWIYI